MDIAEMQKLKAALQLQLADLLTTFEIQTRLSIRRVEINRTDGRTTEGGETYGNRMMVTLDVEL